MKANNVNKNKYVNKGEEKNNKIMNKNEQRNGTEQFILDGIHEAHTHNYVHIYKIIPVGRYLCYYRSLLSRTQTISFQQVNHQMPPEHLK